MDRLNPTPRIRALVTGAGGFIGSHVVRQLLAAGHEVVASDRTTAALHRIADLTGQISIATLELDEAAAVDACLKNHRPDAIVHLAWYADPQDYLTSTCNLASLTMTTNLIASALSSGCRKLVIAGTCVEYAAQDRPLDERDAIDPDTLYGSCKHAAWLVARSLASAAGAELSWARIFHLHGPGEDQRRLIPWVARELQAGRPVDLTDGTQVRDHLHVADVASGLTALLGPGASGVFNVSSGEPVTLRAVLETVADIVGRRDLLRFGARPHRPGERMFLAGESRRLRARGWSPRFGLADGLADALRRDI